jgi:hypothetical protein
VDWPHQTLTRCARDDVDANSASGFASFDDSSGDGDSPSLSRWARICHDLVAKAGAATACNSKAATISQVTHTEGRAQSLCRKEVASPELWQGQNIDDLA